MSCFAPKAHVSAPPYIGVNLSVEGQGIPRKTSVTRRPSTSSKPANISRSRDPRSNTIEPRNNKTNESRNLKGSEPRDIKSESHDSKTSSNESRSSENSESRVNAIILNGSLDDKHLGRRRNHKPEVNPNTLPKNSVKKVEGSWSLGQLQPLDKSPKRARSRSRSGNHGDIKVQGLVQPKGARPMNIPKAVLRYSTDSSSQKQEVPISIGPSR